MAATRLVDKQESYKVRAKGNLRETLSAIGGLLVILSIFLPVRLNPYNLPNSEDITASMAVKIMTGKEEDFGLLVATDEKTITFLIISIGIGIFLFTLLTHKIRHWFIWVAKVVLGGFSVLLFLWILLEISSTNRFVEFAEYGGARVTFGPYWTGPAVYIGLLGSILSLIGFRRQNE